MSRQTRSIYFPYCLHQLSDGHWILLNRDYKPLGCDPNDVVDYEKVPKSLRIKRITPAQALKLSHYGDKPEGGKIYLYSDGSIPTTGAKNMNAYAKRIELLMKLELVDDTRNSND